MITSATVTDCLPGPQLEMLDEHGKVLTLSSAAQTTEGYTLDEVKARKREAWRRREDGSRFRAAVSLTALRDHAGKLCGFVKVIQDMTRIRELLARDQRARETAESATRRLRILADATRVIGEAKLDINAVLTTIAQTLVGAVGDACTISIIRPGKEELERAVYWHEDPELRAMGEQLNRILPQKINEGFAGLALRRRKTVWTKSVDMARLRASAHPALMAFCERLLPTSVLAVPIFANEEPIGVVMVARTRPGHPYTEDDKSLVEDLAHRTALAICNAQLFEREQRARRAAESAASWLAQLQAITAELSGNATPAQVVDVIATHAAAVLGADSASVYLASADRCTLKAAAHTGMRTLSLPTISTDAIGVTTEAFRDKRGVFVATLSEYAERYGHIPHVDAQAGASWPLIGRGSTLGVLVVGFREPHAFSDRERGMLESLACQCAQALERALLREDLERNARRDRLLIKMSEVLASAYLDLPSVLDGVAQLIGGALDGTCIIRLISDDKSDLAVAAVWSANPATRTRFRTVLGTMRMRPDEGLSGLAVRGRYVIAIEQAGETSLLPEHFRSHVKTLGITGVLCAPLLCRGEVLGTLWVSRDDQGPAFTKEDRDLLAELASRAALAIDNTRLLEMAQAAARRAEEANQHKDEFLTTVSHELRTPLNAIMGWAHMLHGEQLSNAAMVAKGLEVIRRNARAQTKLVEDILDVSTIVTGKLRIHPKSTDFSSITSEALEVVRPTAEAKDITLVFDETSTPTLLVGDPDRLQQVMWNLLSNAIRFTDRGGRVTVHVRPAGDVITICVTDTGRGIEPAFLPFVFHRFRQADSSATRPVGGLGLGLGIVRHIVELHGGRVEVTSEGIGKGSTFCVTLPIRPLPPPATVSELLSSESADCSIGRADLVGSRVLVVDDDPDVRELLLSVLIARGAIVETASSAPHALEAHLRFKPHVIISDLAMPDEDGFALIRKVRCLPREMGGRVPALALTAYARTEDRARALEAGYDRHASKPIDLEMLVAIVKTLATASRG